MAEDMLHICNFLKQAITNPVTFAPSKQCINTGKLDGSIII